MPWHLIACTIPGVIIGGQIGPWPQGSISQRTMERAIGILFVLLAARMFWVALKKIGA